MELNQAATKLVLGTLETEDHSTVSPYVSALSDVISRLWAAAARGEDVDEEIEQAKNLIRLISAVQKSKSRTTVSRDLRNIVTIGTEILKVLL